MSFFSKPGRARTYLLALFGNAALLLLAWAVLYVPDSHVWQVLFSFVLGAALLAGFLALHVTVVQRLSAAPRRTLALACLILLGWLALGYILQLAASHLGTNIYARAGYWNSQLTPHHRATFTYLRLIRWQELAIDALLWIVIPALVLPFAVATITSTPRPFASAAALLRKPLLWLSIAAAYIVGAWLSDRLLHWHPAYSVRGEIVSVVARIALVFCIEVALLVATLAVVTRLLARVSVGRDAVA